MNIKEAKMEIKNAMRAYFAKDKFGQYRIPIEKQRPVFLMGAPGVGKTAIMEQIAQELGVALVSYSMTHHTRQSALGLPFIVQKEYDGKMYEVSEYTMSEIIASVYDRMAESGKKEGILFLDEINCVSETLSPSMLQFLQYKVFGRHKIPDGWIVVTAGNPPEYNNSVREFDIATWDRLKRIDVEPDFPAWKEYAYQRAVHPAILTYLDIKKGDFYQMETTVDGLEFVTARGWSDLSDMLYLYEEYEMQVTERLIAQYIQSPAIAKRFATYYDLFRKYKSDYQVERILDGSADATINERARNAKFDERLTLIGLLLDTITGTLRDVLTEEKQLRNFATILSSVAVQLQQAGVDAVGAVNQRILEQRHFLKSAKQAGMLSQEQQTMTQELIQLLEQLQIRVQGMDAAGAIQEIKAELEQKQEALKERNGSAKQQLSRLVVFAEETFAEGQELLVLMTELTMNPYSMQFISRFGCPEYFKHNKKLLLSERQKEIMQELEHLE